MSVESLEKIIKANVKLTPMMEQYYQIKKQYPEAMLLFRMGDFYEVFFEDAKNAARILNITQTHRGKLGGFEIPMAGIPHHAASAYVDRLTEAGLKVAICEQVQDPKDAKGIVKRAVTQVVSPGMPYDLEKSSANENHYMASASHNDGNFYLVAIDFTTGDFFGHHFTNKEDFLDQLRVLNPKELITFMGQWESSDLELSMKEVVNNFNILKTHLSEEYFNPKFSKVYLKKLLPNIENDRVIKMNAPILSPIGALSYYILSTQNTYTSDKQEESSFSQIKPFRLINREGHLKVTLHSLIGLEIFPKSRDSYKDSLLGFMNKTQSAMGSRLLKKTLQAPLTQNEEILKRQACVESLMSDSEKLESFRDSLSQIRDLERILTKVTTNKATPSDLINVSIAIEQYLFLKSKLSKRELGVCKKLTAKEETGLRSILEAVQTKINDQVGASLEKGNLIRPGACKKRDKLSRLANNASEELKSLEARYREETGIVKLRVKSNNVAGYFIEISKSHTDKAPEYFKRRQTLVNAERYSTEELTEFEKEIILAKEKLEKLEREIYKEVVSLVNDNAKVIHALSSFIASLDVFQSFAWIALQENFIKPNFIEEQNKKNLHLEGAWHPLIKSTIKEEFVCHDLKLDNSNFFGLITGPNMAGKTTVMREVAIIQLLAQSGSFVPASKANLNICDYLFSRLGASDDIQRGQSTFMVEMSETAEIISHATENSLIILDEVGRGTSTYDGLSIAWALVEHLINQTKALTLFATHYHELIDLVDQYEQAKNLTVQTHNENGDIHFLYKLIERPASQSFGIYVAKLASLPKSLLHRSQEILDSLEKENQKTIVIESRDKTFNDNQLSFFEAIPEESSRESPKSEKVDKLYGDLEALDITKMTPLEALNKLHQMKENLTH